MTDYHDDVMRELRAMGDHRNDLIRELRALGIRITFHAGLGDAPQTLRMHGLAEQTPESLRKVAEIFGRAGLREVREGVWASTNAGLGVLERWEVSQPEDDHYRERASLIEARATSAISDDRTSK